MTAIFIGLNADVCVQHLQRQTFSYVEKILKIWVILRWNLWMRTGMTLAFNLSLLFMLHWRQGCAVGLFCNFFKIPFLLPFKILTLFATLAGNFAHPWHTLCVLFNRMANVFMSSACLPQHLGCYTQGCFVSFLLQLYRSSKPLLINYFRPFVRKGCVQLIFISAYS